MLVLMLMFVKLDISKSVIAKQPIPRSKSPKVNLQQMISGLMWISLV